MQYASIFMLCIVWERSSMFTKKLACIAIDIAQLIWGWKTFQKEYTELGTLRHCFPKVSMMALSATLAPNIIRYIEKSLYLHTQTRLYKQPIDRPIITQIVNPITKPRFKDLDFLISKAKLIPKTMVFIDKIDDVIALATCLWNLLLPEQHHQSEVLICTYYSTLENSTQSTFLKDLQTRKIQIWICTNAVRMGVNIPNIT